MTGISSDAARAYKHTPPNDDEAATDVDLKIRSASGRPCIRLLPPLPVAGQEIVVEKEEEKEVSDRQAGRDRFSLLALGPCLVVSHWLLSLFCRLRPFRLSPVSTADCIWLYVRGLNTRRRKRRTRVQEETKMEKEI